MASLLASTTGQEEWEPIFNGRDLTGWHVKIAGHELGDNYRNTFRVDDGILRAVYDDYPEFAGEFGHLFYERELSHYRLRVEYRFVGDAVRGSPEWAFRNSGVMLHSQSPSSMALDQEFPVSIELQFLGGGGEGEGEGEGDRPTANLCTPGTHVVMNGQLVTRHCIGSSARTYHGDVWVTAEVLVRGGELIEHIVDGEPVLTYTAPTVGGDHKPAGFPTPDGSLLEGGYIALQAEGHPVEFRRVELMVLSP